MKKKYLAGLLAGALAIGLAGSANAYSLNVLWHNPNTTSIDPRMGGQITVGPGVELSDPYGQVFIDLNETSPQITFTFKQSSAFGGSPPMFNGFRFQDNTDALSDFTNVSVSSTNVVGLNASRISFDADNVLINFAGLPFSTGTYATFDVSNSPVPVPAAVWLLGSGLVGLVGIRGRRGKNS